MKKNIRISTFLKVCDDNFREVYQPLVGISLQERTPCHWSQHPNKYNTKKSNKKIKINKKMISSIGSLYIKKTTHLIKYGLTSGVNACSQPNGRSPVTQLSGEEPDSGPEDVPESTSEFA